MASKEDQRAKATERLAGHLLATGLGQTSLRQLAKAAQVSDRMLLYYFESKEDALAQALALVAGGLTDVLNASIPDGSRFTPSELARKTSALVLDDGTKPFFRLWTEMIAAAARDEAPYTDIVRAIAEGFLVWLESHLEGSDKDQRQANAAMILAQVDGLALLEICTDTDRVRMAANQLARLEHPRTK